MEFVGLLEGLLEGISKHPKCQISLNVLSRARSDKRGRKYIHVATEDIVFLPLTTMTTDVKT
jgi:hypothetical protein